MIPLRDALFDEKLLGNILVGDSWNRWRALMLATAGEPLISDDEREHYKFLTGREKPPEDGVLAELLCVVGGRRGGKSRAMTTLCAWLASCCDWSDDLALGERGRIMVVAPTTDQANNTLGYLREVFHDNELLASLVERETQDEIHLKRRIVLEVQAASAATARGKTAIAVLADESAFLKSGDATDSDANIFQALRPCLASTNGILLLTSSPSGEDGVVYDLYRKFYRPDADPRIIVARGSTQELNPRIRDSVITRAYEQDPDSAASEYGAEFRAPSAAYITRELVERCIERGVNGPRRCLPKVTYFAHCDPAHGGAGRDSFAMCIGHKVRDGDRDITVIDLLHEDKPGFDPLTVIAYICGVLKSWGITEIMGDQAGKPYITAFARHGIRYKVCPLSTSEIYMHALPSWTSGTVCLHDNVEPLVRQLVGLKRRIGQSGRETIDHAKSAHAHDDIAVAVSGVIYQATPVEFNTVDIASLQGIGVHTAPRVYAGDGVDGDTSGTMSAWIRTQGYTRAKDGGLGRGSPRGGVVW
jgi:hypothetical protein